LSLSLRNLLNFWLNLKLINLYHLIFILISWIWWRSLSIFNNLFLLFHFRISFFTLFFFFKIIDVILFYGLLYLFDQGSSCFNFSYRWFLNLFFFFWGYFYFFLFNILFFNFFDLSFFNFFNWRFLNFFKCLFLCILFFNL
jgi:hypothetical protein